jgi:hypothetical protein
MNSKELAANVRNIGPKSAKQLIAAKIDSPEKLKESGTEQAFARILQATSFEIPVQTTYLLALEGAIYDCDWRAIDSARKEDLKRFATENQKEMWSVL